LPFSAASLSKNRCIGFSEFNELNESLNQRVDLEKEGAFIWQSSRIRFNEGAGCSPKKSRVYSLFVKWLPPDSTHFRILNSLSLRRGAASEEEVDCRDYMRSEK
jgi:hypothetical protein